MQVSDKGVWHWSVRPDRTSRPGARAPDTPFSLSRTESARWRVSAAASGGERGAAKLTCVAPARPPLCPPHTWWGASSRSPLLHLVGMFPDIDASAGERLAAVPLAVALIDLRDMLHMAHAAGAIVGGAPGAAEGAAAPRSAASRPKRPKHGIKVYALTAHPLRPSLLACGTNVGTFVLALGARLAFGGALLALSAAARQRALGAELAAAAAATVPSAAGAPAARPTLENLVRLFYLPLTFCSNPANNLTCPLHIL